MKILTKPLKVAVIALLCAGTTAVWPSIGQAQEAKEIFKGILDLIDQNKNPGQQRRNRNNDQMELDETSDTSVARRSATFSVGGTRLGEPTKIKNTFNCNPSDQFKGFDWCSKKTNQSEGRGEYQQRTSLLVRQNDDVVAYVNRELSPAFFAANEIKEDIDKLTTSFQSSPNILTMPKKPGLPTGIIATWGDVSLEPLDEKSLEILATGESPRKGILADFLNDLAKSAKERLPVYRLAGSAGYVWIATHDNSGRGKLRFFAVDNSALNSQSTSVADNPPPQAVSEAIADPTTSSSSSAEAYAADDGTPNVQQDEAERNAKSARIDEENRVTAQRAAQTAPPEWKHHYSRSSQLNAEAPNSLADASSSANNDEASAASDLDRAIAAATRNIYEEAAAAATQRRQQFNLERERRRTNLEADVERRRKLGATTASAEERDLFDQQQRQFVARVLAQSDQEWRSVENFAERRVEEKIANVISKIREEAAERARAERQRKEESGEELQKQAAGPEIATDERHTSTQQNADSAKIAEQNRSTAEQSAQSAPPDWKQNYNKSTPQLLPSFGLLLVFFLGTAQFARWRIRASHLRQAEYLKQESRTDQTSDSSISYITQLLAGSTDLGSAPEGEITARKKPAFAECSGCNNRFAKNEMRKVTRTVGGGYSPGRETVYKNSRGIITGTSRSSGSYRVGREKTQWYCVPCSEDNVRSNWISFICIMFIFLILVFVFNSQR